jgi:hypothetical protein
MESIYYIINFLLITFFCKGRRSDGRAEKIIRLVRFIDTSQIKKSDSSFDCYWLLFLDRRLLNTYEPIKE